MHVSGFCHCHLRLNVILCIFHDRVCCLICCDTPNFWLIKIARLGTIWSGWSGHGIIVCSPSFSVPPLIFQTEVFQWELDPQRCDAVWIRIGLHLTHLMLLPGSMRLATLSPEPIYNRSCKQDPSSMDTDTIGNFKQDSIDNGLPPLVWISTFQRIIEHLHMQYKHSSLHMVPFCSMLQVLSFCVLVLVTVNTLKCPRWTPVGKLVVISVHTASMFTWMSSVMVDWDCWAAIRSVCCS
jgi:hypothetical protein